MLSASACLLHIVSASDMWLSIAVSNLGLGVGCDSSSNIQASSVQIGFARTDHHVDLAERPYHIVMLSLSAVSVWQSEGLLLRRDLLCSAVQPSATKLG